MADPTKRDGDYVTLKLYQEERDLIQNLGRGRAEIPDRYTAFEELAAVVPGLELEDVREKTRQPIRIRIPPALRRAIDAKVKKTGQTFIAVLIAAAAEYRRQHPFQ